MDQTENFKKRILAVVGIIVFLTSVTVAFENCGQGVHMNDNVPSVQTQTIATPTPTPGMTPAPTPSPNPSSGTFMATNLTGAPTGRCEHLSTSIGGQYFIYGGIIPSVALPSDGFFLDPATNTWTAATVTGGPGPRIFGSAVYTGTSIIVWGGSYTTNLNTGGIYNLATKAWTTMSTMGSPVGRYNHAAAWTGSKLLVWGGVATVNNVDSFLTSGGLYDPATDSWSAISTTGAPTTAGLYSGTWTGSKFVVFGGAHGNQGGIYDPASNSWTALPTTGLPGPRDSQVVFSNGTKVVVWGGYKNMNGLNYFDNTGAILDLTAGTWTATSMVGVPEGAVDRSIAWSGSKLYAYEPQRSVGAIFDLASNSWLPLNANGGLTARFNQSSGMAGNAFIQWGGCLNSTTGANTGTIFH